MAVNLQAKLLRVLEDHTFRRIGGIKDMHASVRVICASNRDMEEVVEKKQWIDFYNVEKELIKQALIKSGGNQSKASRLLSITRDTLRYKMKKYKLKEEIARISHTGS